MITTINQIEFKQNVCQITHNGFAAVFFVRPSDLSNNTIKLKETLDIPSLSRISGQSWAIIWASQETIAELVNWAAA